MNKPKKYQTCFSILYKKKVIDIRFISVHKEKKNTPCWLWGGNCLLCLPLDLCLEVCMYCFFLICDYSWRYLYAPCPSPWCRSIFDSWCKSFARITHSIRRRADYTCVAALDDRSHTHTTVGQHNGINKMWRDTVLFSRVAHIRVNCCVYRVLCYVNVNTPNGIRSRKIRRRERRRVVYGKHIASPINVMPIGGTRQWFQTIRPLGGLKVFTIRSTGGYTQSRGY